MPNDDLLKWVTSDEDFYSLLGITFESCSESELRRAYRKTALKYHPDKVGKDFDPAKYELFQAANEVLSDPELKAKYDGHRNAKLQKQRANDLFEGRRKLMKEDLEAREKAGGSFGAPQKRMWEEDKEFKKLSEEGAKRRKERESMMGDSVAASSPAPSSARKQSPPPAMKSPAAEEEPEEDLLEKQEREVMERLRKAEAARAKRKAEKKARKSGVFVPVDSSSADAEAKTKEPTATPIKRPDIFKGLKADEKSSASPKFSFSPSNTPQRTDFAATMARLKAAEKQRLEEQIRQQEAEATN